MGIYRNFMLGAVAVLGLALPVVAAERAIIVLDGSGSMWAQIDGKARITIARETLYQVLPTLPDDLELGFMTYGHREKGNCADIEMLVEPAVGSGAAITAAADAINPKGMTPISDAVRLAAEDLQFTEQKATVILITDGLETCEVDPCALATDLENRGIDFITHVLGFGLSDEEGQQVACLAENTGGQYLSANDGDALVEALSNTVAQVVQAEPEPAPEPAPEPEPVADYNYKPTASLAEGGPDLVDETADLVWEWHAVAADGSKGEWIGSNYNSDFEGSLEPGDYIMSAAIDYASAEQPVTIVAGDVATPHFVLNAAILKIHPLPSEGAAVDDSAAVEIRANGQYVTTNYGDIDVVVPAGALEVDVTIGQAMVTRSFEVAAGDTIDEDVIVGVGLAKIASVYVAGQPVTDDLFMEILKAAKALDGSREQVSYGYGGEQSFELAPGDYVVAYSLDGSQGEAAFTIRTGELTDVAIDINSGIVVLTVPDGDYVEVLAPKADIAGNRAKFGYGFGPEVSTTLPAGDYVAVLTSGGVDSEVPITIVAGERLEVTMQASSGKTK